MAVNNFPIERISKRKDNKMSETTFENAKVGDRVWSSVFGAGIILDNANSKDFPIYVKFSNFCASFMTDGKRFKEERRTLFWEEIDMIPPERPKRKVKKVIEGWVNIYGDVTIGNIHPSIEKALFARDSVRGRVALGDPYFIHHEFLSEE